MSSRSLCQITEGVAFVKAEGLYGALALGLLALSLSSALPEAASAGPPVPTPGLGSAVSTEGGTVSPSYTGCGGIAAPVVSANYEQEVVELVNAERAKVGRPPLKRVAELDRAARYYATDMSQDDYFPSDHGTYDRSGGNLVWICEWSSRIWSYYPGGSWLGENIAKGYSTPQSVMTTWMNSEGHKQNILRPEFWEIGVGYYNDSTSPPYWVQDFGRRSGVYPIVINREAATTDSVNVSLYIYGQGIWSQMRLRNDDGPWTDWQPFQSILNWTLNGGAGDHAVWVEMRNGSDTTVGSDTVQLAIPVLGNLPDALQFTYSIPDQRLLPASHQVMPLNEGNDETLTWNVAKTGSWFTVSPAMGTTPTSFWITPTTFDMGNVATYTGVVSVTVVSPTGVGGSPHVIDLTLRVVNTSFNHAYLPLVVKN